MQAITIRETQIKTFDGERVSIPNAEVDQSVISVQTAYGPKRTSLVIGLDDWEDLDAAADIVLGSLEGIDGVESDPAPQAHFPTSVRASPIWICATGHSRNSPK